MKKIALSLCVSIITIVLLCSNLFAWAYTPTFDVSAKNALLVNIDTDEIIYSKNADDKIYTASLSYLMNAIVVCEKAKFDDVVTVDGEVVDRLLGTGAIVANLKAEEQISVGDLMRCMLISSHNDAALVLAEYVGGSTKEFVKMMNDKAKFLGMSDSQFNTPIGLFDEKQYTTARDLFKLYMAAMDIDSVAEILSQTRYTVPETNKSGTRLLSTTTRLIDRTTNYYYKYALAGKTGNSDKSGRCIASTAENDGKRYVCILAGCDPQAESRTDFSDSISLYKWAFGNFEYKTVVSKGEQVSVSADVDLSWDVDTITLTAGESVVALLPKDADLSTIEYVVSLDKKVFDAPIKKNEKLGTAKIYFSNPTAEDSEPIGEITLLAGQEVEGSVALLLWRWIGGFIGNPFVIVLFVALVIAFIVMTVMANVKAKRERKKKLRLKKRL